MYLLYIHAYQSYIWNRAVSARVERHGCSEPLIGDVVMIEPTEKQVNEKRKGHLSNNVGRRDPWDVSAGLLYHQNRMELIERLGLIILFREWYLWC
jgi:hypothetical protein